MWSWALHNVKQDHKEREKLLFSFMESLTWWLQPQIKAKMAKEEQERWPDASNYIKGLREQGASEEYIAKELAEIEAERAKEKEKKDLLGDEIVILRSPDK